MPILALIALSRRPKRAPSDPRSAAVGGSPEKLVCDLDRAKAVRRRCIGSYFSRRCGIVAEMWAADHDLDGLVMRVRPDRANCSLRAIELISNNLQKCQ